MALSQASNVILETIKIPAPSIDEMDALKTPVSDHVTLATSLKKTSPSQKKTYNKLKIKQTPVHYTDDDYFPSTRVTAVRVPPEMDESLSKDTVLLNILNILYENESGNELENGLTVKQICDMLLVKDPNMISLSTKFANLISAKINAYAKKVENRVRGDYKVKIKYWIIRKWAKGNSPRRMVYIYKGLLPDDYTEAPPKMPDSLPTSMEIGNKQEVGAVFDKSTVKEDKIKEIPGKNINYSTIINGTGLTRLNSINGVMNNSSKSKTALPKNNNKFSVNFNRFQQFGYKGMSGTLEEKNGSNNKFESLEDINKSPLIDKSLDLDDDCITNNLTSSANEAKQVTKKYNKDININRADLTKQLQFIQKSIYQASPVQRIQKYNRDKRRNSTNLIFNKRWMDTLKSGFMYEEISTPDKLKLSDFDRLFD